MDATTVFGSAMLDMSGFIEAVENACATLADKRGCDFKPSMFKIVGNPLVSKARLVSGEEFDISESIDAAVLEMRLSTILDLQTRPPRSEMRRSTSLDLQTGLLSWGTR